MACVESSVQLAESMLRGYAAGAFAMAGAVDGGDGIHWFDPDPRAVLGRDGLYVSRSLRRTLDSGRFSTTIDRDTEGVIRACGESAEGREDTWLSPAFMAGVLVLVEQGWVHSAEAWRDGILVGGVYGVHMNGVFFAESMFSRPPAGRDASKVALVHLVEHCHGRGIELIDCQFLTEHLASLGFVEIAQSQWRTRLHAALMRPTVWMGHER